MTIEWKYRVRYCYFDENNDNKEFHNNHFKSYSEAEDYGNNVLDVLWDNINWWRVETKLSDGNWYIVKPV